MGALSAATLARRYGATAVVAYHESAHALMAHRLGRRVERVCVGFCRDSGETVIQPTTDPSTRALIALAGERGERRCRSWLDGFAVFAAGSDDRKTLGDALGELGISTAAGVDALIADVDGRLRDDWRALDRLARRLDDQRILDGAQVAELVG